MAIETAIKAQADQLLRMEKAILAFEREAAEDRHGGRETHQPDGSAER